MNCFIYKIINNVTGEKYVGQTTNFSRRINDHINKLKNNKHPNPKLQASWNKYGELNFFIEKEKFDLTKEELDLKEIEYIEKENSFLNGFNLTAGGTGGDTKSKIKIEDFYEIYLGNEKYEGLINRTAKYYNCDSSTVSSIKRKKSYDRFREITEKLSNIEKEEHLSNFERKLKLEIDPPKPINKKLNSELVIIFLCLISVYGRGIISAFLNFNHLTKGLKKNIEKGTFIKEQKEFSLLTDKEIEKKAIEYFTDNNLQNYCKQKIIKFNTVLRPSWIAH